MIRPQRVRLVLFLVPFFLGGVLLSVCASGVQEKRLEQAELLIEEKKYNEAIRIISEVIQTDPKSLDQGEALLKKIRDARSEYNKVFGELTEMLKQEDIDEDAAFALLQHLRDLDNTPNKASERIVSGATAGIVFKVNDREFRRIMDEAALELAAGEYWKAVELYLSGFNLHREQFELDDYGNIVENRIDRTIADIQDLAGTFLDRQTGLLEENTDLNSALASSAQAYLSQVETTGETLLSLISIRNALLENAGTIEEQRQILLQGKEEEDIPFLSTIRILSAGRGNEQITDGLSGAVIAYFDDTLSSIKENAGTALDRKEEAAKEVLADKNWNTSVQNFQDMYTYALAEIHASNLEIARNQPREGSLLTDARVNSSRETASQLASTQEMAKRAKAYIRLIEIFQNSDTVLAAIDSVESEVGLSAARPVLLSDRERLSQLETEWKGVQEYYRSIEEAGIVLTDTIARTEFFFTVLGRYGTDLEEAEAQVVHRINGIFLAPVGQALNDQEGIYDQAVIYVEGVIPEGEPMDSGIVRKYPSEAIDLINPGREVLKSLSESLERKVTEFSNEKAYIQNSPLIVDDIAQIESYLAEIEAFQEKINRLSSRAEQDVQVAEQFKLRGLSGLNEAERLLRNNEFEGALDQLDEAGVEFAGSLEYQYDPDFQEEIDARILQLAETITREWQNLIVRQVRSYINEAESLYQREEFGRAQTVLLRADDLWNSANAEENQEILAWLTRTENALRATTGRVIGETNPLYTEMSNILNLAQRDFQNAMTQLDQGNQAEANRFFTSAEEKIAYIKDTFPINQAAGILQLKIDQLRDPDNFKALFRKKYDDARAQLGTPEGAEGYSTLKDLQQINPQYPGIDRAIYQFEISLGIREPPPDPAKIAEAERLYRQAQQILSKTVVSDLDFEVALDLLNEAYENNPNNKKVTELKDRAQLLRGGTATVLTSDDQQKFRKAEQLFLDRRYFEALAIVERLLENPENQRYAPLTDLKRRLDPFL